MQMKLTPRGVKVAIKDARDKVAINQDGFYVAPGLSLFLETQETIL
jgi:hypothetical protein